MVYHHAARVYIINGGNAAICISSVICRKADDCIKTLSQ